MLTIKWSQTLLTVLTYMLVFLLIFPVIWMVITGFKHEADAYTPSPVLIFQPTIDQFLLALNAGFVAYLFNSIVAALVSTAIAMLLGIPAAYSMVFQMRKVRMRFQFIQEWFLDLAGRIDRHRQSRQKIGPGVAPAGLHSSGHRLFQILDAYVIRSWLFYFAALLVTFTGIYMIFDFFQLLGDIVRNHVTSFVVVKYCRFL